MTVFSAKIRFIVFAFAGLTGAGVSPVLQAIPEDRMELFETIAVTPTASGAHSRSSSAQKTNPADQVLRALSDDNLTHLTTSRAAVEMNRRGVAYLSAERDFETLTRAVALFDRAAKLGDAGAYANLALAHFALSNLTESVEAAETAVRLNRVGAFGLLAYFKIEAIHVERDLAGAWDLLQRAEQAGADVSPVTGLDVSYQFFPSHWVALQKALRDKGFFDGKPDGKFGDDSKNALTAYQKSENLAVTTKLTLGLLDSLGLLSEFNAEIKVQKYVYGTY